MSAFAPVGNNLAASSLADYIDLLLPSDPDALITAAAHVRLRAQAAMLPPIPRIAVECRLAEGADQVDLQLCVRREHGDYDVVAAYAAGLAARRPDDAATAGLARLAARLADPCSELNGGVAEVFLECDLPDGADVGSAPAVFLSLPDDQQAARSLVGEALRLLRAAPPSQAHVAAIAACFAACEGDAEISHLGVMLSRPIDAVRLNVKGLRPSQIERFLAACHWPGDRARAAALFDAAADRADRVTLALDVGEAPLPRIGVECFTDMQPQSNPAWRARLDELCAAGLCTPAKADAYLAVPAAHGPDRRRPWPADLIIDSLLRPDDELTALARRVVHFKITETAGAHREAKAYFGAGMIAFTPGGRSATKAWRPELAAPRPRRTLKAWPLPEAPLDRSLALATRWLLNAQQQSGLWRDFHVPTGVSDEWVSGFVGTQLAITGDPRALSAAEACLARLRRRQRTEGGWGYNTEHPCDADSSAWALRLASALGDSGSPLFRRGRAFIRSHLRQDGALVSFLERDSLGAVARLPQTASLAGWLHAHDCVTAGAAPFLVEHSTHYLRGRQQADGAWAGYWWEHPAYPTWLAAGALRAKPAAGDAARLAGAEACAQRWIGEAVADPAAATGFDVSCALRILIGGGHRAHRDCVEAGVKWLVEQQAPDGGWPPGARLRLPAWRHLEPDVGGEMVRLDRRGAFSTAAAVGALAEHRAAREA